MCKKCQVPSWESSAPRVHILIAEVDAMNRRLPIVYSALLLTGVNLLLRMAGTSFQVYLSGQIGPEGIGLLQLVMSVSNLALVAGVAGVRTAAMYLTAGELGRGRPEKVSGILSGCFLYSIACSSAVGLLLWCWAPVLAERWIGNVQTIGALRLYAAFLPGICLCAVMTGYFTAANRIGTLAAVEVAEQLCSMGLTLTVLRFWAGQNAGRACISVVLGSGVGCWITLGCLLLLRLAEHPGSAEPADLRRRLLQTAVPLAGADILRSGIGTAENLLVPRRLGLYPGVSNPLAVFGILSGMVFPVLMFPACILFGLGELLIPELARCAAGEHRQRIQSLTRRSLHGALLYGAAFGSLLFLLSDVLCMRLYRNAQAGRMLRLYAPLIPMLYCDAITDAMTKGLGQQRACVRYNILTNSLDVLFLYFLLPKYGITGYFVSFVLTHALNFFLSLRRLCRTAELHIPLRIPAAVLLSTALSTAAASLLPHPALRAAACILLLPAAWVLTGVMPEAPKLHR